MRWLLWILAAEFLVAGLWGCFREVDSGARGQRRSVGIGWWSAPAMVGLGLMVGGLTTWREGAGRASLIPFFGALLLINRHNAKHAPSPWLQRLAKLGSDPVFLVRHPVRYLHEVIDLLGTR